MLPADPKPIIALFVTNLIILYKTAGTTQQTNRPQLLLCKEEVNKIHKEIFISFLE